MEQNSSEPSSSSLRFFIAEQKLIMVVTFVGALKRDSIPVLEECLALVTQKPAKWVILHLRDVAPSAERPVLPHLAKLQKALREKPAQLKLCSVHPELRRLLEDQGVIRPEEVSNNLAEALQSLNLQG